MTLTRRTPIARSTKPIARTPLRQRGPRAWRPKRPAGEGRCLYCLAFGPLTWDHVIPRSLLPGPYRDSEYNLVKVCGPCNVARTCGYKPSWILLPPGTRTFVLDRKGIVFAQRYFLDAAESA